MGPQRLALTLIFAAWIAAPAAQAADAQEAPAPKDAKITYLTAASIYIDAGRNDGLVDDESLEILRDGQVIGTARVTYLSEHRAVCVRDGGETPLQVGDVARFVPKAPPPAPSASPGESVWSAGTQAAKSGPPLGLRGRVGVQWLAVKNREPGGERFTQPALDLFLDGAQVAGAPIDFTADVRSRRSYRTVQGSGTVTDGFTSVYRLAAAWHDRESPWRITLGRQFTPSLASVSIFDGLMVEYQKTHWGVGMFTGTQPEDGTLGYSTQIREHGAFVQWRNAPGSRRLWNVTTGAVGSYDAGQINREFGYLQTSWSDRRLSMWLTEEVDLNRGWKKEAEGTSASLTSTFFNLRWRAGRAWTLSAGYDNRRNVRLFRDRITPVTEFDDQYRTGAWAGASVRFLRRFSAGFDLRSNTGGSAGGANGYSVFLGAGPMTRIGLDVRTRSTRYTNDFVEGWLHSITFGTNAGRRLHLEISGGERIETSLTPAGLDTTMTWYGFDADVSLGRHWFAGLSLERDSGDIENNDQGWMTLSYRF